MQMQKSLLKQATLIPFLLCHLLSFLLFFSWYSPVTSHFWACLDDAAFHLLNGSLKESPLMQVFWALANLKICDLFGAVFMVGFSLLWVFEAPKIDIKKRLAQILYLLIWFEIGIFTLKEVIFPYLVRADFLRDSPSLLYASTIHLSKTIPWLKIKDSSHWSFPGDHALIALQWAGFMAVFSGWRLGLLAFLSSTIFILPRLIAGAHWLSDSLAGSLPLAILFIGWARYTPIYDISISRLEQFLTFISPKRKQSNESSRYST
jgi:Kdo2-lipid A phosphotransferase